MAEKLGEGFVEREARLFEAGDYPDKGITVTEEDLDRIVRDFTEVPIKIEHTSTPFDGFLGTARRIWRKGRELWADLVFPKPAWELAESAGARKLSVGLKRDKSGIAEVSLVSTPRVASAQVFSGDATGASRGDAEMPGAQGLVYFEEIVIRSDSDNAMGNGGDGCVEVKTNANGQTVDFAAEMERLRRENEALRLETEANAEKAKALEFSLRAEKVDKDLDSLKRAGKLTPAMEPFARAIMVHATGETIRFSDNESLSISELCARLLAAIPVIVDFGEHGRKGAAEPGGFQDDQIAVYMKLNQCSREKAVEDLALYGSR
jgi:hypothetical protein